MKISLDAVITAVLVVCAVITTGVVVHREFFVQRVATESAKQKPVFIKEWQSVLEHGVRMGPWPTKVNLIEFGDFECPFCGSFHRTLKTLREGYPADLTIIYVHFPLEGHRFAIPAARAAECAGDQGRFEAMYDLLFEQQDKFGFKPWAEFAVEAGVADGAAFEVCIKRTEPLPRVTEGKALGSELNVQGTPTLIINGWKLGHPPSLEELDAMVKAILAGKSPVGST